MNIFYTNLNPKLCAKEHTNRHVCKMLIEYCQLLSTAHRVLDGDEYTDSSSGRRIKRWKLDDTKLDSLLYKATHLNHPSAIWARESGSNYMWLVELLSELCEEYTYRYGKVHKCEQIGLVDMLFTNVPKNIKQKDFTEPTPAMPDHYIVKGDSIASYKNYVRDGKIHLHNWKNREIPSWVLTK